MEIVKPKKYTRETFQEKATIPAAKGGADASAYGFQWMLFKPQAHAVVPFEINQPSRSTNVERK